MNTKPSMKVLLEELNLIGEHQHLEAKLDRHHIGKETYKTISGFANAEGGWVVMGVEEQLTPNGLKVFMPVGVVDAEKTQSDIVAAYDSIFNVTLRPKFMCENVDGVTLVALYVAEAEATKKPIYLSRKGLPKGAFIRLGSSDKQCTDDDIERLYQERDHVPLDASVVAGATMEDLDPRIIERYRKLLGTNRPSYAIQRYNDHELLRAARAIELVDGDARPTITGLLCFGTPLAMRRFFPAMRVDYIRISGKRWIEDSHERFTGQDILQPLLSSVYQAMDAVLDEIPRRVTIEEGQLQRREVPKIPRNVVREALVNALMHRNYRSHGAISIIRYSNRIEIRNPGCSLVPQEELGQPGSKLRNPNIARILYDVGLAETKGSGIPSMRKMMGEAGLEPPTLETRRSKDEFVITLPLYSFLDEDVISWIKRFKELELSDVEVHALIHARETGEIRNARLRELTMEDTLTVSKALTKLRDKGLLDMHGSSTATYYTLSDIALEPHTHLSQTTLPLHDQIVQPGDQIVQPGDQIVQLDPRLLKRIAKLGAKNDAKEMQAIIVELCRGKFVASKEIRAYLNRTRGTISTHVKQLIEQGRLQRLYPQSPSHPEQAYRAVDLPADESTQ